MSKYVTSFVFVSSLLGFTWSSHWFLRAFSFPLLVIVINLVLFLQHSIKKAFMLYSIIQVIMVKQFKHQCCWVSRGCITIILAFDIVKNNFSFKLFAEDGGYSHWTVFSRCTKSCGTGVRFRTRSCNNPEPQFGGKNCSILGEDKQTFMCNMNPCPGMIKF